MHKQFEVDPKFEEARSHMKAARQAFRSSVEAFLPAGFVEGKRKARREMLLAMRSLMDVAIDHIDHMDRPAGEPNETKA